MKKCLDASIDEKTKICIVGTMPGQESLRQQRYYANNRNLFWQFIQQILGNDVITLKALLSYGIGLWDVLDVCEGKGSLDKDLKNGKPNDFEKYPQVKYYLFNGQKAYKFFIQKNRNLLTADNYRILPSTSPANASQKKEDKLNKWKNAIEHFLT